MADRFGISLRTVYRDIRSLEEAGVPIAGEAGVGYSLMEGYRLPPVLFTKEEAMALVMAEKMVETLTDGSTKGHYTSALYKIKPSCKLRIKTCWSGSRVAFRYSVINPVRRNRSYCSLYFPLLPSGKW